MVELLQLYEIEFLGSTYDPWDILMYIFGIGLGIVIGLKIIDKLEKQGQKNGKQFKYLRTANTKIY